MIVFHRKEQFDILPDGIKRPLLVIGWKTPDRSCRLFCLWKGGIWLRGRGRKRYCWVWARSAQLPLEQAGSTCPVCKAPWVLAHYCEYCQNYEIVTDKGQVE